MVWGAHPLFGLVCTRYDHVPRSCSLITCLNDSSVWNLSWFGYLISLLNFFLSSGWHKISDGDFKTFYKHEYDSPVHFFRARCTLEAPAEVFYLVMGIPLGPYFGSFCSKINIFLLLYFCLWCVRWSDMDANAAHFMHNPRIRPFKAMEQILQGLQVPEGVFWHGRSGFRNPLASLVSKREDDSLWRRTDKALSGA